MVLLDSTNKQINKLRTGLKMTPKQLADLVDMDESIKIENGHSMARSEP